MGQILNHSRWLADSAANDRRHNMVRAGRWPVHHLKSIVSGWTGGPVPIKTKEKEEKKKKRFLSKIISRTTSASITLEPFLASQLLPSSGYGGVLPHVLHNLTLIGANYAIKAWQRTPSQPPSILKFFFEDVLRTLVAKSRTSSPPHFMFSSILRSLCSSVGSTEYGARGPSYKYKMYTADCILTVIGQYPLFRGWWCIDPDLDLLVSSNPGYLMHVTTLAISYSLESCRSNLALYSGIPYTY